MITWMQKHKKWLITTIWISTIAFVGAGFVGWGSYKFGQSGGDFAKVGNITVKVKDVQNQYQNLYSQYKEMFGDKFNDEMAKNMKLKDIAFNNSLQNALILNYAKDLGLQATNIDVVQQLIKIDAFQKNGKFDKSTYIQVLAQNNITPVDFEISMKQEILIQKINSLLKQFTNTSKSELKQMQSLLFMEDRLKIQIINPDTLKVDFNDAQLKAYWEQNKSNYLSSVSYKIQKSVFNISEDAKSSKNIALKSYLKLKNNKIKFQTKEIISENDIPFTQDNLIKFNKAKLGKILKPMLENNKYFVIKILEKINPSQLSFNKAKQSVTQDFINYKKEILLDEQSKKVLANFNGKDIGYITRESIDKVPGLNSQEAIQFFSQLFLVTSKKDIIKLDSKVVVYEILDTRLAKYDDKKDLIVNKIISNIKYQVVIQNFINQIKNKYEIIKY
jgi:peptidyl-prolyl cis-trans isomerase D